MLGPLLEVEMSKKVHAVVARSTFRSQKCKKTLTGLKHFWKLRFWKKCTPLWREAHFQVKIYKTHHSRTTFGSWDVEKVHAVVARSTFRSQKCKKHWRVWSTFGSWDVEKVHAVVARSTFPSQNLQNTPCSDHFWRFRFGFGRQA